MKEMRYALAKEESIFFDLPDSKGLRIRGILRGRLDGPVAVMMHGRPGSGNELLQYLGARYLYERGISTLRLFMYDFEPNTRNFTDCNLQTHADDFDVVVNELRKQNVPQIFALGHSYGGLTILKSKAKLDAAVLWDPAHGSWWADGRDALSADKYPEVTVGEYSIGTAGSGWVYSATAKKYDQQLGDTSNLAVKDYPLKIISAGSGKLKDLGERYFEQANEPKSQIVIADAHHSFEDSDEVILELLEQTYGWLAKVLASQ